MVQTSQNEIESYIKNKRPNKKKIIINKIKHELSKTIEILGGKSDILSIIGDWSDLSDETILEDLEMWNETAKNSY